MRIIFTCGGTAGHIYPAVSVANLLKERHPNAEILFVGAENGMETQLVPRDGYNIQTIKISNLRHSLSPKAFAHNAKAVHLLLSANSKAREILNDFRPDIVVGTGGYASYPITAEASKKGIPTAIHESNAMPGWTTRMLAPKVSVVLVSFDVSKKYYPKARRVETVGTPVRAGFLQRSNSGGVPLVLSFWGSLGASEMNKMMLDFIKLEDDSFRHIHIAGKRAFAAMKEAAGDKIEEFLYDMPSVMTSADVVICRAGASTLAELCASGRPSILIPSPNVTNNHQDANARVLENAGAAIRIPESECTAEILYRQTKELLRDIEKRAVMSEAAENLASLDSAERIYQIIMSFL
ncbi:MAG: undecaprenyldiphospho-muramoylpentapeptide beta-N-acetylglucosaminyltransferase [Oscillospiraceae bacterium]|nr:undecaprenyldiphospho-muramoylpentapeptide beta-N-acetylglucosaminyltransferase [Oscillospiraceae bacterium]